MKTNLSNNPSPSASKPENRNKIFKNPAPFLLIPVVAVLAAGTVVEKFHGSEYAIAHVYGAWWFYLLMALVGLYALCAIVRGRLWQRPYLLLVYSSAVLMLTGGALTAWTGKHGSMTLSPGVPTSEFEVQSPNSDNPKVRLPFAMRLESFDVVQYPGTRTPMDFVSHLTVEGEPVDISMNNIYRRDGYRFYQEDYDEEGNSTLSVAYDPWGIGVTYAGYVAMFLGIVWFFAARSSRWRRLLKGTTVAVVLLVAGIGTASAAPRTLPRATADKMGQMYVLYKGRVCPLQTMAKDYTTKLCGSARYDGLTPEQVFSGWLFYTGEWVEEPMIKIKGDEVRRMLGIEGRRASYRDFLASDFESHNSKMSKPLRAAGEKYSLVQMMTGGKMLKMFPVADSTGQLNWYAQADELPFTIPDDEYFFIRKQLSYCQELAVAGRYDELERVFEKTRQYQQQRAGDVLPSPSRFKAERLYNHLTTGKWLAMLVIMLGLIFFALELLWPRLKMQKIENPILLLVTLFLGVTFVLRWGVGGHIPMAGGFDSMNLMAMVVGIVALAMSRRYRMASSIGLLAMGFCLLVAMMSGSNPPVTNLMPVLNSPLLTLHVTVIMMSYALFFFVMLNGVVGLVSRSRSAESMRVSLLMLYPAVSLLAIGIVIGALWANISWGNYWSWDPKEVWALITLLLYVYPLVGFRDGGRSRGFHVYCILAFFSVIVTYFGVNFILGGIHAYN